MRRRLTVPLAVPLTVLAALAVLLSGCQPAVPPSPSPTTPAPTPAPTPTPTPTENAQEREERIAYEQAEAAYRAFGAEYDRVAAAGGSMEPTAAMRRYAGGSYLRAYARVLRQQKEIGAVAKGRAVVAYVKPSGFEPASLLLASCEDGSKIRIFDAKGKLLGTGVVARLQLTARKVSGSWLIWQSKEEKVRECSD